MSKRTRIRADEFWTTPDGNVWIKVTSAGRLDARVGLSVADVAITATPAELNLLAGSLLTAAELAKLDDSVAVLTKGSGMSAMANYASGYFQNGGIKKTQILIDLEGLVGSTTDLDIIGNTGGAANCHIGQITAALNGSIIGGLITCLEVPTGGVADIDFYSASEATGAQDALVTSLTETALLTSGGSWTLAQQKALALFPTANDYLYVANGAGGTPGTFTAGKFLIELFGV